MQAIPILRLTILYCTCPGIPRAMRAIGVSRTGKAHAKYNAEHMQSRRWLVIRLTKRGSAKNCDHAFCKVRMVVRTRFRSDLKKREPQERLKEESK